MNNATTLTQTGMNNATQLGITNLNNLSAETIARLNSSTQLSVTDKNNATQLSITDKNNQTTQTVARINQETQTETARINGATQKEVQEIQAKYSTLTSTNAQAATLMQQGTVAIANIQQSSTMGEDAKRQAIANIQLTLQGQLSVLDASSKLNLSGAYKTTLASTPGFDKDGNYIGFPDAQEVKKTDTAARLPTDQSGGGGGY